MKSKFSSQVNEKADKKLTKLSLETSTSNTNKKSEEKTEQAFFSENFNYNFAQATALFKQIANSLFVEKEGGFIEHCLDMISNNLTYQEVVYKSFWDQMSGIYQENQLKSRMETSPLAAGTRKASSLSKLLDWKKTLIAEFQNIINYTSFEPRLKSECSKQFSDTQRNLFDLLLVLSDQKYFGARFLLTNKNHQFMDSMFSVHRNDLPANSFKKLNEISAGYMEFNNDQLRNIAIHKSYVSQGNGKKQSPYSSDNLFDFSKANKVI